MLGPRCSHASKRNPDHAEGVAFTCVPTFGVSLSPRKRIVFTVLACIVVLGGSFVFLHSDGRADRVCDEAGFFVDGHLSLWPLGAACTYGEPATTAVRLNPLMFLPVVAVVVIVAALWPLRRRTQPVT